MCSAYSNTWLNTKRTSQELSEGVAPIHQSGNLTTTLPFEPGSSRNSFEECAPQAPNQYSSVSGAKGDLYPKLVEPVDLPPSISTFASKTESDDPGSGGSNVCKRLRTCTHSYQSSMYIYQNLEICKNSSVLFKIYIRHF